MKRFITILAVFALLVTIAIPLTEKQAEAATVTNHGLYKIINRHSGQALEVYEWSHDNGANVTQWHDHGGDNQLWRFVSVGSGYYQIINAHSGRALEVHEWSNADGGNIVTVPGAADGLTRSEISFIRQSGIKIMPIYSDFREAVGLRQSQVMARNAIYNANLLGIPRDVVIFANVERFFEVDEAWIRGWVNVFYNSDYKPGFYHDPVEGDFSRAYCQAVAADAKVHLHSILWSAEPEPGVSAKDEAPRFQPAAPPCQANVWAWQYGRDSTVCPIDTNLISPLLEKHLWA